MGDGNGNELTGGKLSGYILIFAIQKLSVI